MILVYKDKNINNLTRTIIRFWNNGNKTIRSEDLNPKDLLRFEFDEETQIYSSKVIKNLDTVNGFILNEKDNIIEMRFDYFEPKKGVKIEILHDRAGVTPSVKGKVIDVRSEIRHSKDTINGKIKSIRDFGELVGCYFASLVIAFAIGFLLSIFTKKEYTASWTQNLIIFVILIGPMIISNILLRWRTKNQRYPKNLE